MKITVNRSLTSGVYWVSFKVSEFSQHELLQMERFGIPYVNLKNGTGPHQATARVRLNQVNEQSKAGFSAEDDARTYEDYVLGQIREGMNSIRDKKDDFTASEEVTI